MRSLSGLVFGALLLWAGPLPAQPLTFIESRTFTSNYGFLIAIPPDVTACRGGDTDHGFLLFLGPKAPCASKKNMPDELVPWIVEGAPPGSPPHIEFAYSWNAAFRPESAWEFAEGICRLGPSSAVVQVSAFRLLGGPGIECLRMNHATGQARLDIRFHRYNFAAAPGYLWTDDDDGFAVPVARYTVSLRTSIRDYKKHRETLRRVFDAIALPSRPEP
jgi:hypothetical protein